MAKSANKKTKALLSFLVALLIVAYRIAFAPPLLEEGGVFDENTLVIERVERMLAQVGSINFDAGAISNPVFRSLRSIETPLISVPVGKENPFSL